MGRYFLDWRNEERCAFGEAVVVVNPDLRPYFRYVAKQSGAILAKGWLIGMQFIGLFENDAFTRTRATPISWVRKFRTVPLNWAIRCS